MAKPELGTKRTCPNCGTKYYDLNRNPIICPSCGTLFEAVVTKARPSPVAARQDADSAKDEMETAEEKAELVPLEEADEEAADTGAVAIETEDEEEIEASEDDTFLEEDEEDEDDVSTIIGDVDDEEER